MSEQFSAAPKVVKPKNKYKQEPEVDEEDQIKLIYNNLMWDKRVFRGNTYSAIVVSKKNDSDPGKAPLPSKGQKNSPQTLNFFQGNRRANIEIFTDEFVQSLTDKPPKHEYGAQTLPLPQNTIIRHRLENTQGVEQQTQIWDDQLFDFDFQVQPLLNVLCGRTLQISRMEVLQEEELRIMNNRQQELKLYQKQANKKIKNMYDHQEKLQQQNLKNIAAYKSQKERKIKTHRKIFARVIAKQYLRDIKINTLKYVQGNGFFRNPIQSRLVNEVLPYLYRETQSVAYQEEEHVKQSYKILQAAKDSIIRGHAWAKYVEKTRRKQITDKRQELAREKQERKKMYAEQKQTIKFLAQQKVFLEQEEAKRLQQEAEQQQQGTTQ